MMDERIIELTEKSIDRLAHDIRAAIDDGKIKETGRFEPMGVGFTMPGTDNFAYFSYIYIEGVKRTVKVCVCRKGTDVEITYFHFSGTNRECLEAMESKAGKFDLQNLANDFKELSKSVDDYWLEHG